MISNFYIMLRLQFKDKKRDDYLVSLSILMSHTKLVKITIYSDISGQNHSVRGFNTLISNLSKLLNSQNILHEAIQKYQYSAIMSVKIRLLL
jgi:hypothetical protein